MAAAAGAIAWHGSYLMAGGQKKGEKTRWKHHDREGLVL
jgi:hypothetical protein